MEAALNYRGRFPPPSRFDPFPTGRSHFENLVDSYAPALIPGLLTAMK
jgi:hypothetical protein